MINPSRETIAVALFNLLQGLQGIVFASRRPALWDDNAPKPALYLGQPMENYEYRNGTATPAHITMDFDVFLYVNVGQENKSPDTQINNLLDTIETGLAGPASTNFLQTLGGIVNHTWIEGPIHRAPGYLNGQGMVIFTIRVLVPSSG